MNDTLATNLQALITSGGVPPEAPRAPYRWLDSDPGGDPQLRTADGRTVRLGSARNPRGEAEALVTVALGSGPAPAAVAVIGAGSGALLEVLAATSVGRILVFEPDPELAVLWLSRRSWAHLILTGRLQLLVGPEYLGTGNAARALEGVESLPIVAHPVLAREYPDAMLAARQALDRVLRDAAANADARRRFEDVALVNTVRNLPALLAGGDVRNVFGRFRGMPALLLGAGPSLDRSLPAIAALAARAVIIAADTALLPCLRAGVQPAMAVALDPGALNGRHLRACWDAHSTWLVTEPSVDPDGVAAFADRAFYYTVGDHAPWPWLQAGGVSRGRLDVWGSVVTAALDLALKAGCSPVVFCGLDLAFTDDRPYCRGTIFEEDWAWAIADGRPLETHWASVLDARPTVLEPDLAGLPARTAAHLVAFRDHIRDVVARHPETTFVNASTGGILHGRRILRASLHDVAARWPVIDPADLDASLRAAHQTAEPEHAARRVLASRLESTLPIDVARGHSAPSLAAGLITAELVVPIVERLRGPKAVAMAPPTSMPRRASVLLADQVTLWQAARRGLPAIDSRRSQTDASAVLAQAYVQLLEVLSSREFDVSLRRPVAEILGRWQDVPAGMLFDWPNALAPAVERFSAAMVEASRHATTAVLGSFDGATAPGWEYAELAGLRSDGRSDWLHDFARDVLTWQWLIAYTAALPADDSLARAVKIIGTGPSTALPFPRPHRSAALWLEPGAELSLPAVARRPIPAMRALAAVRVITGLEIEEETRASVAAEARSPERTCLSASFRIATRPTSAAWTPCDPIARAGHPSWRRIAQADAGWAIAVRSDYRGIDYLDEAGRVIGSETWPFAIRGCIALGGSQRLAWNWQEHPRLLYRVRPDAETIQVELPVVPYDAALMSDGQVCLATSDGLWSWHPHQAAQPMATGAALVAVHVEAEELEMCPLPSESDDGRWFASDVLYRWSPGEDHLRSIAKEPGTVPCAVAIRSGWRAEAWLDSSVIRLVHDDGRTSFIACSGPRTLAWVGQSLIVSTQGGELLRFADLLSRPGR